MISGVSEDNIFTDHFIYFPIPPPHPPPLAHAPPSGGWEVVDGEGTPRSTRYTPPISIIGVGWWRVPCRAPPPPAPPRPTRFPTPTTAASFPYLPAAGCATCLPACHHGWHQAHGPLPASRLLGQTGRKRKNPLTSFYKWWRDGEKEQDINVLTGGGACGTARDRIQTGTGLGLEL